MSCVTGLSPVELALTSEFERSTTIRPGSKAGSMNLICLPEPTPPCITFQSTACRPPIVVCDWEYQLPGGSRSDHCLPQKSPGVRLSVTNKRRIEILLIASSDVGF
jgi:hypothetical protein